MESNLDNSFRVIALLANITAKRSIPNFLEYNNRATPSFSLQGAFLSYVNTNRNPISIDKNNKVS